MGSRQVLDDAGSLLDRQGIPHAGAKDIGAAYSGALEGTVRPER
ncbi:hypothetical protein [Arthrobacter sp. NPDC092385]